MKKNVEIRSNERRKPRGLSFPDVLEDILKNGRVYSKDILKSRRHLLFSVQNAKLRSLDFENAYLKSIERNSSSNQLSATVSEQDAQIIEEKMRNMIDKQIDAVKKKCEKRVYDIKENCSKRIDDLKNAIAEMKEYSSSLESQIKEVAKKEAKYYESLSEIELISDYEQYQKEFSTLFEESKQLGEEIQKLSKKEKPTTQSGRIKMEKNRSYLKIYN